VKSKKTGDTFEGANAFWAKLPKPEGIDATVENLIAMSDTPPIDLGAGSQMLTGDYSSIAAQTNLCGPQRAIGLSAP